MSRQVEPEAPSFRALQYLSSCLLSQSEECTQMQMPPCLCSILTHTFIIVGNSIEAFCSLDTVQPRVCVRTHTHTLYSALIKCNQRQQPPFLPAVVPPNLPPLHHQHRSDTLGQVESSSLDFESKCFLYCCNSSTKKRVVFFADRTSSPQGKQRIPEDRNKY